MRQTNGDSSLKFFRPRTINLLSVFLYGFPVIFGSVTIAMLTKEISEISQTFMEYNHGYSNIISGQLDNESISSLNSLAIQQLISMLHRSEKALFLSRLIGVGCFFNGLFLLSVMSFGYYRILKAVGYQIDTFRKASEHQAPLAFAVGALQSSYKLESTPVSNSFNSTSSGSIRTQAKRSPSLIWITPHLPTWLPSLRPDPEFLGKPGPASPNTHFDSQKWESLNQEMIHSQYKALKRYKVNLIWQASCNALIVLSFLGLNVTVCECCVHISWIFSMQSLTSCYL
jgi:hypothetical protein